MKYVQPLNLDTLVAMHAITLSLKNEIDDDLLTAILWGTIAFHETDQQEGIERTLTPPISDIVTMLQKHNVATLPCVLSLTKKEADFYRKTAGMQKRLKTGESKDRGILSKILKGQPVETTLPEGASIISLLLTERRKALGTFETFMAAAAGFEHPFHINFQADSETVNSVLEGELRTYLSAFKGDRIRWATNAMKWAENRKRMMVLLDRFASYATVWITSEDIVSHYSAWGCDHPIETLFALMMEGCVTLETIAVDGESNLRFSVKLSGLPAQKGGTDFHNLRTEKMMIWNTQSPNLQERFNEGRLYPLWQYLLSNIGKKLLRQDIIRYLEEESPARGKANLDKIYEGLIQKLQNVSGETRETVDSWFERDDKYLFLKSEKT